MRTDIKSLGDTFLAMSVVGENTEIGWSSGRGRRDIKLGSVQIEGVLISNTQFIYSANRNEGRNADRAQWYFSYKT